MDQPTITFILNDKTYSVRATDSHAIRQIPSADRQQLISLLEAVKQQDALAHQAVDQAVTRAKSGYQASNGSMAAADPSAPPPVNPERLGSGDGSARAARACPARLWHFSLPIQGSPYTRRSGMSI